MDGTTNGLLIVVAQDEPGIYRNLRRRFEAAGSVRIVRDRRLGDRRRASASRARDRRISDRRVQPDLERRLGSLGYATIPVAGGERPQGLAPE
jgi:hypothetical protein